MALWNKNPLSRMVCDLEKQNLKTLQIRRCGPRTRSSAWFVTFTRTLIAMWEVAKYIHNMCAYVCMYHKHVCMYYYYMYTHIRMVKI